MSEFDYNEDLAFDKHQLDVEWENQPVLYMKWAELFVEAIDERDRAKEKLDLVRSETDLDIREERNLEGGKKPTEAEIANLVIQDGEYQKALKTYLDAKRNAGIMQAARDAMEHRKKALEAETSLWIGGYYSEPRINTEAKQKASSQATEEIRKGIRRRIK